MNEEKVYKKVIERVTLSEVCINVILTILKILGGIFSFSSALLSDGFDSLGDCLTSFVGFIAGKEANKKADNDHQFGHKKIENLVSLMFGMVIIFTSFILIYNSITSIINKTYLKEENYNFLIAIIVSLIALFIKISTCIYVSIFSKKTKSPILKAQALDHLLDSISTLISLISVSFIYVFSSINELKIFDNIASLLIALIMIIGAIKIVITNSMSLLDKSCSKEEENKIKEIVLKNPKIYHIDALRSRIVANYIFLEIEVTIKEEMSLKDAHDVIENVRMDILKENKNVKHCLIHVNPFLHDHIDEL